MPAETTAAPTAPGARPVMPLVRAIERSARRRVHVQAVPAPAASASSRRLRSARRPIESYRPLGRAWSGSIRAPLEAHGRYGPARKPAESLRTPPPPQARPYDVHGVLASPTDQSFASPSVVL